MPKNYIEYSFLVLPSDPWEEILLAELQSLPFESFENSEGFLKAYVPEDHYYDTFLDTINLLNHDEVTITFEKKIIEPVNWNAKWESEFHPILIGDDFVVRADFQKLWFELAILHDVDGMHDVFNAKLLKHDGDFTAVWGSPRI